MALTLSAAAILEKNKLEGGQAWIILIKVVFSDGTTIRVARDLSDVVWDGFTWTAFPFELDDTREEGQGEHAVLVLRISNVSRVLQAYMEAGNGGVGASVDLYVVHSTNLASTTPEVHETFIVMSAYSDSTWASFDLAAPNQVLLRFPPERFLKNFCRWSFKSTQCGYSGATPYTTCDKTLGDCRLRGNVRYNGSFPGIPEGALFVSTVR